MAGQFNWPHVLNLSNSIIGVTVLAMPFCFQQCGVVLGTLMLFFCTWLTLMSCRLLITAGISSRKRSYGFLAQYTHGAPGKLAVELGMIGLQMGTLVAQVVIIGDLGPAIISKWTGLSNTNNLRTALIMLACTCIGLPLGLLRNLETVSRASTFCICFYSMFVLYVVGLSVPNLKAGNWYEKVNFWRVDGLFKCLPIFSFAFGCQTQLFILYDALPEPSLKEISAIVGSAVNMCTVAYLLVGFFGYVAFCDTTIGGDVITQFSETLVVDIIQILFVLSIVVSFPLIIYPCRGSFYTLLFAQKPKHEDIESRPIIPEIHFKVITVCIVMFAMITGILVPNVEFVLAMNGATMGTLICYIFPAVFFLRVMTGSSDKKNIAQFVFIVGVTIMVLCTYTTLNSQDHVKPKPVITDKATLAPKQSIKSQEKIKKDNPVINVIKKSADQVKDKDRRVDPPDKDSKNKSPPEADKRQEPPNPHPPDKGPVEVNNSHKETVKETKAVKQTSTKLVKESSKGSKRQKQRIKTKEEGPEIVLREEKRKKDTMEGDIVGEEPVRGEEEVDGGEMMEKAKETEQKQQDLLDELKKQQIEHKKLIEEQREILKELKEHKKDAHKKEEGAKQTQAPLNNGGHIENQNAGPPKMRNVITGIIPQQHQNIPAQAQVVGQQQILQNVQQPQGQQQQGAEGQNQVNQQAQQVNLPGQSQLNQQPQQVNLQGQGQLNQQPQQVNQQGQGQLNQQPHQVNIQGQGQFNQQLNQGKINQGQQLGQNFNQQPIHNDNFNIPNQQSDVKQAHARKEGDKQVVAQESRLSDSVQNKIGGPKTAEKSQKTVEKKEGKLKTPHSDI
ncbi:putative sodium-coupled neutral amino acid transporter 10 [Saccostrea echinata]|uniref:putative sodium-coupled neutral amino acid transporter 10 n=1 Tax=Saccostrea echinata TaxID=191078 RepID=UPI002A7FB1DD|nr:putative sodium-coupled neutral amino acid transporter 10 [Saccostrea echinata]